MQLTTFCWKQLRITLLRVCAMYFIRMYLSGTQQYNTIQHRYFISNQGALSGRTINKEFNTMIMDWLRWLEDDNNFFLIFFFMKQ